MLPCLYMEIEKILESLGLGEKDAKIYLALLQLGTASAYAVANESGLKRPTAYFILDELAQRGIVHVIADTKKKLFRASPPEELLRVAEERLQKAKKILPQIQAMAKKAEKPQIFYFEGVAGIEEAMNYRIKDMAGKEIVGLFAKATGDTLKRFDNFRSYNNRLKSLKITERGIAPLDPTIASFREEDEEYGRQIKAVSQDKYSSTICVEIGEAFVKFYDFENLQSLVIENTAIAKTMKETFEMAWGNN